MIPARVSHLPRFSARRVALAMLATLGALLFATATIAQASPPRPDLLRSEAGRAGAGSPRSHGRAHRGRAARRRHHHGRRRARTSRRQRPSRRNRHERIGISPNEAVQPPKPAPAPAPAPEPSASLTWRGDFETGDLSQWEIWQEVAPDRIAITNNPVRQGSFAARFEVRPGDNIGDTPTRAELAANLHEKEGEERWYRWYTYFPESFPTNYPSDFITFTQWRALDESDAYSSFMVWGDQVQLRHYGTRWSTTLTKGVWHKFVYHVKWSPDPSVGFIELWYDDQQVVPKEFTATMAGTPGRAVGNYVKEGLYKSDNIPTAVLYQDGFVAGTSFAEVNSAP